MCKSTDVGMEQILIPLLINIPYATEVLVLKSALFEENNINKYIIQPRPSVHAPLRPSVTAALNTNFSFTVCWGMGCSYLTQY